MREIKAMAWDELDKVMICWEEIGHLELKEKMSVHTLLSNEYAHFRPLLYTGLNDRKGNEIYDGYIAQGEHALYLIRWDDTQAQYKAKIIKTTSVLTKNCSFPLWQYVEDDGKCRFEIIGNIYEHPHLLGEKGEGH